MKKQQNELIDILKVRFNENMNRHKGVQWSAVEEKLSGNDGKLKIIYEMERTGGEPDVVALDGVGGGGGFVFCDCSKESPAGRRSFCYDHQALDARKEHKPENSIMEMAIEIGLEVLDEIEYRNLQKLGNFDTKTSSWIKTPDNIRKLGGAIFGDYRYGTVFIYHNGATSYYKDRGFRGRVIV